MQFAEIRRAIITGVFQSNKIIVSHPAVASHLRHNKQKIDAHSQYNYLSICVNILTEL